ncbi:carbohydrate-binding module family 50 protein [Bipolaris zeicola 26-R-13]|uniref:Carbohydrate-binding module family 50 protein n=1 Tax=Cochliobolus carbonum (strain 26-R-13) TaxID=930089 RepID=W6YNV6_COCC2|nr:carbohydrate-binding module family 50 protein [Bipolaris zeicola 26-R-13]EUC39203.1 carbohydrate-binding module family 50 protein [Bipolaris zeicola 26-R-13]
MSGYGYNQGGGGGYGQNEYNGGQGGYGQQPPYQGGEASQYYGGGGQGGPPPQGYSPQQGGYDANAPPQYQQYPSTATHSSNSGRNSHNQGYQNQYGGEGDPEGERGIMGGLAGAAAGGYGGHALGGKSGHGTAGAIVGALAGAFAGHKTQDAVGERWDEHKEKKKEEEERRRWEEEEERRRKYGGGAAAGAAAGAGFAHHQSHNQERSAGDFGGNFSASSQDIRLDAHGDYVLHAQCRRTDGSVQASSIALNRYLANDDGSFRWSGSSTDRSSGSENTYTVQQGDTLRAIASRYSHCSFDELARHNNISNPDQIWPGQNLRIPTGGGGGGSSGGFASSARNVRLVGGGQRLEAELESRGEWRRREINLDERISNRDGCLVFV